jgi:protein associated with RNAse G/E
VGNQVQVQYTKWGGRPHWRFTVTPVGSDEFGWWLGARNGLVLQRGDEAPITQHYDLVMLVPKSGSWIAFWNSGAERTVEVYVDVTTRPRCTPTCVEAVDLDLDVIRFRDGRVELVDEDEFADHQVRYSYPPHIVEQATSTAAALLDAVTAGSEPFGAVGPAWLARYLAEPAFRGT